MVYNFLCKDEKNTQKYLLTFALHIGVERSPPFFRTVYPNRNHVTTHPGIDQSDSKIKVVKYFVNLLAY